LEIGKVGGEAGFVSEVCRKARQARWTGIDPKPISLAVDARTAVRVSAWVRMAESCRWE
jgi:hypothetical protein